MRIAFVIALIIAAPVEARAAPGGMLIAKLETLAATGNAKALYHLGMSYHMGAGVPQDRVRALDYFRQAAARGDPLAAYKLGCFHAGQDGVLPVDLEQALSYKLVAARAGYALAQSDVAGLYLHQGKPLLALEWMDKAVAQGTSEALFGEALLHNGKNGLPRDAVLVAAYFTLFLGRREASPDQRKWLDAQMAELKPQDRDQVAAFIGNYRPAPSALTMEALSGQRAAEILVSSGH